MTLKDFLEQLEKQGITPDMEIDYIDFDSDRDGKIVDVEINPVDHSFTVY